MLFFYPLCRDHIPSPSYDESREVNCGYGNSNLLYFTFRSRKYPSYKQARGFPAKGSTADIETTVTTEWESIV